MNIDLSELLSEGQLLDTSFSPLQITLSLLVTLLMVLFVYFVYKKTYNGVLYSKNFNLTLIITALVVDAIMIGISGNLVLSLGMVGALSIVRFRTAVKDPKDTAFLFWAITIGVINGVAYYELSLIASIFIAAILFVLSRKNTYEPSYVLILKYTGDAYIQVELLLKEYLKKYIVRSDSRTGDMIEKVIEVKIKPQKQEALLTDIRSLQNVTNCTLLASNGEFAE